MRTDILSPRSRVRGMIINKSTPERSEQPRQFPGADCPVRTPQTIILPNTANEILGNCSGDVVGRCCGAALAELNGYNI